MIKGRKLGHIGFAVDCVDENAKWYIDNMGFEEIARFQDPNGNVYFLKNGIEFISNFWDNGYKCFMFTTSISIISISLSDQLSVFKSKQDKLCASDGSVQNSINVSALVFLIVLLF